MFRNKGESNTSLGLSSDRCEIRGKSLHLHSTQGHPTDIGAPKNVENYFRVFSVPEHAQTYFSYKLHTHTIVTEKFWRGSDAYKVSYERSEVEDISEKWTNPRTIRFGESNNLKRICGYQRISRKPSGVGSSYSAVSKYSPGLQNCRIWAPSDQ